MKHKLGFNHYIFGSWLIFITLQIITYLLEPYRYFPAYGFIGYALTIGIALVSLNYACKRWHYLTQSVTLIVFGALASLDIIWSRQEILNAFVQQGWHFITTSQADGYIQLLLVIMNIFTGGIAANSLFHGLNRHNFIPQKSE